MLNKQHDFHKEKNHIIVKYVYKFILIFKSLLTMMPQLLTGFLSIWNEN